MNIALGNTAIGTMNNGTEVIMDSAFKELSSILKNNTVVTFPTHTPICHAYQCNSDYAKWIANADYKFICGTNILRTNMLSISPLWNINIFNSSPLQGAILVGVGRSGQINKTNFYTQKLYKKVLSHEYVHSVRDDVTKEYLERMGFRAINTGCISMWGLTKEFCCDIPTRKSLSCIVTLNCKSKNPALDNLYLKMIKRNYSEIYFWPQTIGDYDYFMQLSENDGIAVLTNSLSSVMDVIKSRNPDYVGYRLHGGIFCIQQKVRAIIIAVDYRALDIQNCFNLNVIPRENLDAIETRINSEFVTDPQINEHNISVWKSQFEL